MISKDELVKSVAQSCGVSVEISDFFFEVFINRLSNKLKPGDLLHFHNYGFFHKRNCRIHIEKTAESPTPKSYLIQLVLFSSELKIRNDLADIHFLKIPNLKTLWVDDKEFQKSLNAGDFSPYTDRNQLIKSFATKAEVIISSLRKDYDSELVEELIIPLSFDLNFLVKSSQKSKLSKVPSSVALKNETEGVKKDNIKVEQGAKIPVDDGLPWNYGTKFLDKEKTEQSEESILTKAKQEIDEVKSASLTQKELRRDQSSLLKDFQRVTPTRTAENEPLIKPKESQTVKFSVSKESTKDAEKTESSNKFTEVKSRTESYRQKDKFGTSKNAKYDKYSSIRYSSGKSYTDRRNFLPIVAVVSFIVIALLVIYIYFIKGSDVGDSTNTVMFDIKPPPSVNVIDRDYKYIISYPYPKIGNRIEMSGFSDNLFSSVDLKPEVKVNSKPEIKTEPKFVKGNETEKKPVVEIKIEKPVEETPKTNVEVKKEETNRIFLYRNFFVVYVGTYSSEETAEREADKYFDLGYNAIVENLETREGKRVYKLSVGDFTSEEFAKDFLKKYIK